MLSLRKPWGAALLVSIVLMGCPGDDTANDIASGTADASATADDNEGRPGPMCLQPPWIPGDGDVGVQSVACAGEREFGLVLPGTTPVTQDLGLQFLEEHRDAIHAIEGVESSGYGLCCEGTWPSPKAHCIAIGLRLCSTTASDLIDVLTALQGSAAATSDVGFKISVGFIGLLGPRCESDECGALPYRESNENAPPAKRTLVYERERAAACEHDGECVVSGCGNQCDHWSEGGGSGTCEGRGELEAAFCGCVDQQCSWFR